MKLSCSVDSLQRVLRSASQVASTRTATPAYSGVLIDASGEGVRVRATDSETSVTTDLEAAVESPGVALVPARLLASVVASLPPGTAQFESRAEQGDVELLAGTARFHIRTLASEDFPTLPEASGAGASLPAAEFAIAVERVARAASSDEIRPILTSVLVDGEGTSLRLVATDSYRLCLVSQELDAALPEPLSANIPARAMREVARLVGADSPDAVALEVASGQAVFSIGTSVVSTRLVDGQFPNYKQLIPETFDNEARFGREEFLDVARRVRQMAQKTASLQLGFTSGELTISTETQDVGDASESLPAPGFDGEELTIAFNPQYLIDGVEGMPTDEFLLRFSSPLRPGLLVPPEGSEYTYLVMPMRTNQ